MSESAFWSPRVLAEARAELRQWLDGLPEEVRRTAPGGVCALAYVSDRPITDADREFARSLVAPDGNTR